MTSSSSTYPTYIYKIVPCSPTPDISTLNPSTPILPPSELDLSSKFIHMSTASQVPGTLKHFFPTNGNVRNTVNLLKVSLSPLEEQDGVVTWESPDAKICGPRPGEGLFPHLYFQDAEPKRLWLRRDEVEDVKEVISEVGKIDWEEGLKDVEGWLV